jgi:cellulose 1,4-beta-cellobiosidase
MLKTTLILGLASATVSFAQNVGHQKAETHLPIPLSSCSGPAGQGVCTAQQMAITLDSNWRWTHQVGNYVNCYTGNTWNSQFCPDAETCTKNCAIDGVPQSDWTAPYGIHTVEGGIQMDFVTRGQYGTNIGSRVYMLDGDQYKIFKLKNHEFTFDVDVSNLPCGLNGALYFVEMDADGGSSKYPDNKAGAKYGTGYCDAQCPHDMKFIQGQANVKNWKPSPTDSNSGTGYYGTCCAEMDIWESNSMASAFTAHPCSLDEGNHKCEGTECGDIETNERYKGVCDKDGCDINAFRMGVENFFGPGSQYTVDTTKPITVVTQFLTADNTDSGDLVEIKRLFVQNGKVIQHANVNIPGLEKYNSITDAHCDAQKTVFDEPKAFQQHGGLKQMGKAMERGMVLVMSLWDDHYANMLWLDSDYPLNKPNSTAGVHRGPCSRDSGKPTDVETNHPDSHVKYYNIKIGTIGSTYGSSQTDAPPTPTDTPTSSPGTCSNRVYDQCDGAQFTGKKCCPAGSTCKVLNDYYSQCYPSALTY